MTRLLMRRDDDNHRCGFARRFVTFNAAQTMILRPDFDHKSCCIRIQASDDYLGDVGHETVPFRLRIFYTGVVRRIAARLRARLTVRLGRFSDGLDRSCVDRFAGNLYLTRPVSLFAGLRVKCRAVEGEACIPSKVRALARPRH